MTTALPTTIRAITITGTKATLTSIPLPKLRPSYVLIKIHSVALNPTDWKHISRSLAAPGGLLGCDFAGTVISIGSAVTKPLSPGDRVAGVTHGANFVDPESGCFAEYALAKGDLLVKLPETLSFEDASTFPLGISTVGQGLFQKGLKMTLPSLGSPAAKGSKEPVLIYGGSTATGALGIQMAVIAGYRVFTTCGMRNEGYVRGLGAEGVFDYRDPECGRKINEATGNELRLAWDTISEEASAKICAEALAQGHGVEGSRYATILPVKLPREGVTCTTTMMYTIFGERYEKPAGTEHPASKEDFEFAKELFGIVEGLLAEGKLKTHEAEIRGGGLAGVLEGLKDLKENRVSGKKLVYRVGETPEGAESTAEF